MEAMTITPSPVAARPAGQSCAPAGRERKVRKVHIHGKAPSPAEQSRASGGGSPSSHLVKRAVGKQDPEHKASERILSEIISILKAAGDVLAAQLPGINDDPLAKPSSRLGMHLLLQTFRRPAKP